MYFLLSIDISNFFFKNIVTQLKSKGSLVPEAGRTSLPDLLLSSLCKQGSNAASKRKEIQDWSKKFQSSL
jgi:hypothetical protein